jgi:hypothetical protein
MNDTIAAKLLIGPGTRLWFSPIEWLTVLGPLPPNVTMVGEFAASTTAVLFVSNAASLRWFLDRYRTVMAKPPAVWVCYPAHGRVDLNRASLTQIIAGHTLHPVSEFQIDAEWSAMRIRSNALG